MAPSRRQACRGLTIQRIPGSGSPGEGASSFLPLSGSSQPASVSPGSLAPAPTSSSTQRLSPARPRDTATRHILHPAVTARLGLVTAALLPLPLPLLFFLFALPPTAWHVLLCLDPMPQAQRGIAYPSGRNLAGPPAQPRVSDPRAHRACQLHPPSRSQTTAQSPDRGATQRRRVMLELYHLVRFASWLLGTSVPPGTEEGYYDSQRVLGRLGD
ncbi:hypothetical protein DAEQUDRAFT_763197 [Daedalea quercina L-15889]|uniref:Uncharacterized protein n=1 Tax=Daedalea quercina L-15889 TaxID=1314783 RepID=A0A165SJ66_9APHY|nr:hypothetical protein DAEQUDRAFT_763197 [Daedalea quercina L-15889]